MPLWTHPLLSPVILLHDNLAHIRNFSRKVLKKDSERLRKQLTGREDQTRKTAAAQSTSENQDQKWESQGKTASDDDDLGVGELSFDYASIVSLLGGKNNDKDAKVNRAAFLNSLNDLLSTAIEIRQALEWDRRYATFLLGVWEDIESLKLELHAKPANEPRAVNPVSRQVRELIRNLDAGAAGFEAGVAGIISALEVQLNMVCGRKTTVHE